jgi:hypothetical protein
MVLMVLRRARIIFSSRPSTLVDDMLLSNSYNVQYVPVHCVQYTVTVRTVQQSTYTISIH